MNNAYEATLVTWSAVGGVVCARKVRLDDGFTFYVSEPLLPDGSIPPREVGDRLSITPKRLNVPGGPDLDYVSISLVG